MPRESYSVEWLVKPLQKCAHKSCKRLGNEKRAMYFVQHGYLASGDIPEEIEE